MNAYVLYGTSQLTYEQWDKPAPGPGEVLLQVKAAGICGSDIPRIYKTGAHNHPLIPGHEFAGVVVEAGKQAEELYWDSQAPLGNQKKESLLGKRMGVFPLIPCGSCGPCKAGCYELCRNYSYLGSRRNGGFAEYAAVPAANLIELPDTVSFEEAAMLEPMAVAVHAMRRAKPEKEEPIAICGLGTIGQLLILFLREAGCSNILAIGNKDLQQQMAVQNGLPQVQYCDSRRQDPASWLLERTEGNGASFFFECVGKGETISLAINGATPAGQVVLVGNPHSAINLEKEQYWKILRNQLTVSGTWNSSFNHSPEDDWHYVLDRLRKKGIKPAALITHRFALRELERGLRIMRDKTEEYGKVMMLSEFFLPL
ncbi:MAG: galactitol-1-phosphate 5-dehydrogenase [Firmicutes bacterium]|nr:galactitol-1-phosphate 5-dehydrogenase [Bacillota bacterium]